MTTRQDDATFLITRGADTSWGPVKNTFVSHNTVLLTGAHSQGFICHAGCNTSVLTMKANLISAVLKAGYADGPYAGGHNMYSGGQRQFKLQTGDFVGDPMFVDAAHGDLSLRKASPAVTARTPKTLAWSTSSTRCCRVTATATASGSRTSARSSADGGHDGWGQRTRHTTPSMLRCTTSNRWSLLSAETVRSSAPALMLPESSAIACCERV